MISRRLLGAVIVLAIGGLSSAHALTPGATCERVASDGLRKCVRKVGSAQQRCYRATGAVCLPSNSKLTAAYATLSKNLLAKCPDQATVTAAGYPAALIPAGLDARLREACGSAVATLVARSYGGPHAAVRNSASTFDQQCLDGTFARGLKLLNYELRQQSRCLRDAHAGKTCDTAGLAAKLATKESATTTQIAARCTAPLETLVAVDAQIFVSRAAAQCRCLVATAHGQTSPLALDCGPRAAAPVPPRDTPTQVVLDGATWGARCGNGSDYAFWVRLAPAGLPVEKVIVYLQGGGACYDGPGCAGQPATRFDALGENLPSGGIFNTNNTANPFRDWTIVYLPYCTQDLHIGGGVTNAFPEITVHRFGAINVRTAIAYVRDVVWAELDATDPEGYRGDRVRALLTGGSAGAYGDIYNYHWGLDELRWPRMTAAPDSGLGMDNGGADGVIALGALGLLSVTPGWGTLPYLAPYCTAQSCAEIFDNLEVATSPRLKMLPEQQILHISNQIDNVQRNTTNFASTAAFVNTLRANYCTVQGKTGIRAFFSALSTTQHTQITGTKFYDTTVGGVSIADWLGSAISAPDGVTDKIATGTMEADYPGVLPFPCTVGSPSGAFIDTTNAVLD